MATHPLEQFRFCPRCGSQHFVENNEKSKHCTDCNFTYYFNPSAAVVAVITNEHGEWLVCRRAKEPAKGTLDLPGGFTDSYETAEQAIAREVLEETGLELTSMQFLFTLPNIYPYSGFEVHTVDLFFHAQVAGELSPQAADDVAECFFLPPPEIDATLFGLTSIRQGVEQILAGGYL